MNDETRDIRIEVRDEDDAPEGETSQTVTPATDEADERDPEQIQVLPLVALRDTVIFPEMIVPLQVGRERSVKALDRAVRASQPVALITQLISFADAGKVGVIAKGRQAGLVRGWRYDGGGTWQSDRAAESTTTAALEGAAAAGSEITFTVVPNGSQTRLGIDRDLDGYLDRDELDAGSDPADPFMLPGTWTNLGFALAGTHGAPIATGTGTLQPLTTLTLALLDARENVPAWLVSGVAQANLPFKGGTMVPSFDLLLAGLFTGPAGQIDLAGPTPAGLPSGFAFYFQWWISDPAAVKGFAASNGLQATAP